MAYGVRTPAATSFLEARILEALSVQVVPLLSSANAETKALAEKIVLDPSGVVRDLATVVRATRAITVESTDAEIDAAILHADTVLYLKRRYGIGVT